MLLSENGVAEVHMHTRRAACALLNYSSSGRVALFSHPVNVKSRFPTTGVRFCDEALGTYKLTHPSTRSLPSPQGYVIASM
jgi:hypothetical protein